MNKKIIIAICVALTTGCIPHPRFDWGNAKYHGQVRDVNGKPIVDAKVIVEGKNFLSNVIQTAQTDDRGLYRIEPEKVFMVFGALLSPQPNCIDNLYVIHPAYNVYFIRRLHKGRYGRLCTDIEIENDLILTKKIRDSDSYEPISWSNAKIGLKVYDYNEQEVGEIYEVNQKENKITIKYVSIYFEDYKSQKINEINPVWFVRKN